MIIKTLSRKSGARNVIKYLFKEKGKLVGGDRPFVIKHNVRGRTAERWIKQFDENEALRIHRRVDNTRCYHTILSLSSMDKEHATPELLKDITKKYIQLRGEDGMYIGTAHQDREHIHVHLVESGTKYRTGKSARMSQKVFHELKVSMDEYQRGAHPKLAHSLPQHGRKAQERAAKRQIEKDMEELKRIRNRSKERGREDRGRSF